MFKPTANAGGKGGVLDRNNPLLEEKFAIIGDGEYEYVFLCILFLLSSSSSNSLVRMLKRCCLVWSGVDERFYEKGVVVVHVFVVSL